MHVAHYVILRTKCCGWQVGLILMGIFDWTNLDSDSVNVYRDAQALNVWATR